MEAVSRGSVRSQNKPFLSVGKRWMMLHLPLICAHHYRRQDENCQQPNKTTFCTLRHQNPQFQRSENADERVLAP